MLQRLTEFIDDAIDAIDGIYNEAVARVPATNSERDRKFALVAHRHVDGSASPEYTVSELAKEAETIGGAK